MYRLKNKRIFNSISKIDKLSNQVILDGTSPECIMTGKGIFFLEYIIPSSGTLTIKDGNGVTILTGVSSIDVQYSPIVCENGIAITGSVLIAKGFAIEGILP